METLKVNFSALAANVPYLTHIYPSPSFSGNNNPSMTSDSKNDSLLFADEGRGERREEGCKRVWCAPTMHSSIKK